MTTAVKPEPMSIQEFAEMPQSKRWEVYLEQQARIRYYEDEDERKARLIDQLLSEVKGLREMQA